MQQKILVTKRFEDEVISRDQDIASCYNQIKLLDEELAEMYAGIIFTAVLSSYRRDGEKCYLYFSTQDSEFGLLITSLLASLHSFLIAEKYQDFRLMCMNTTPPHVMRGLALMYLFRDIVYADLLNAFKSITGIS